MVIDRAVALRRTRALADSAEVVEFNRALESLVGKHDASLLPDLHLCLDDETKNTEVMFGLVHYLESFSVEAQLRAMLAVLTAFAAGAPWWAKVLHYRILNNDDSRAQYRDLLLPETGPARVAACSILRSVASEHGRPVSAKSEQLYREVCGTIEAGSPSTGGDPH